MGGFGSERGDLGTEGVILGLKWVVWGPIEVIWGLRGVIWGLKEPYWVLGSLQGGGRTYVRNGSPLCPTGHRPFGAAALLSLHCFT